MPVILKRFSAASKVLFKKSFLDQTNEVIHVRRNWRGAVGMRLKHALHYAGLLHQEAIAALERKSSGALSY